MQPPYVSPAPGVAHPAAEAPPAVMWARIYALAFALMYLLCVLGGIGLFLYGLMGDHRVHDVIDAMVRGAIMALVGTPLLIASLVGAFAPRKPWGWTINVILMGLGCSSCLCLPAALPMLLQWMKPEVKGWYGA